MIVGSGLIAKSFSIFVEDNNIIIFASGVSSSLCDDPFEFKREIDMLCGLNQNCRIIYFSTASLSDGSFESPYIRHKIEMERILMDRFKNYLILRLPTVVGSGGNSTNLFNHFINCISNDLCIKVNVNQYRSLIDADDLYTLTKGIILSDFLGIVDISLDNQSTVGEIVSDIESVLGINFRKELINSHQNHPISNQLLKDLIREDFYKIDRPDYNIRLIKKYQNK